MAGAGAVESRSRGKGANHSGGGINRRVLNITFVICAVKAADNIEEAVIGHAGVAGAGGGKTGITGS